MIFLAPYWLLAASAILIPVAIHLWNKRQGKTVKVGSIRWLEASASKQWSSIRLTDVGLLLLRCVILLLLAAALAEPFIRTKPGKENGARAVFVSPELLYSDAIINLKETIDPLLLRGYTLHSFTPDFKAISPDHWQQLSTNPGDSIVENGNYWQLLPALALKYAAAQDSVFLFTSDQQRHFSGSPIPLQENINWVPVALDKSTTWLQAAYQTAADSILLIQGQSNRAGTRYNRSRIPTKINSQQRIGELKVKLIHQNDSLWAHWGEANRQRILVKQKPVQISISADKAQQTEVKYLRAALESIENHSGVPIEVSSSRMKSPDWFFWLSAAELPDSVGKLVEAGMQLWQQPGSDPKPVTANLALPISKIPLQQLSSATQNSENIIWFATNGEPVLTSEVVGKGNSYFFRGGFSPEWSGLGQSAQLPDLLFSLLFKTNQTVKYDASALPEEVLKPVRKEVKPRKALEEPPYSLLRWLVLAAFILFLAERFISGKRIKE